MDMLSGISAANMGMSSSRLLTDVNIALMGKVLDTAEAQGDALQDMMEQIPTGSHLLDVYA